MSRVLVLTLLASTACFVVASPAWTDTVPLTASAGVPDTLNGSVSTSPLGLIESAVDSLPLSASSLDGRSELFLDDESAGRASLVLPAAQEIHGRKLPAASRQSANFSGRTADANLSQNDDQPLQVPILFVLLVMGVIRFLVSATFRQYLMDLYDPLDW